jgi:hypothetical protein
MTWVIILIIVVIIIAIVIKSSSKKNTNANINLSVPNSTLSESKQKEMNELLDKLVSIGLGGLTSLEMIHDEKIDIVENVVTSIKENSNNSNQEKELLVKMATQAYDKILTDFKYGEDILRVIKEERDEFIVGINNGTIDSYPWDSLIDWTDGYHDYLQKQLEAVEKEIDKRKGIKISSGFTKYYINTDNTLKFEVSGVNHLNEMEIGTIKTLKTFESKVFLEPEPNNEYDAKAILIKTEDGSKIGYVNKDALPLVHSVIDRITKCEVSKISDHDIPYVWIFVVYDGECLKDENN